jgi:hypothetical protein
MHVGLPAAFGRVLMFLLWVCCDRALGGDSPVHPELAAPKHRMFVFSGIDVGRDSAFAWAGVDGAPLGRLEEDGLRLRAFGGKGRHRYRTASGKNESDVATGELLAGFHRKQANAGVTLYVGPQVQYQRLVEHDAGERARTEFGLKAAMELYARLDPLRLINASASASTVKRAYHARGALLREISPAVAIGVEAAVYGDKRYVEPRAGIFVNTTNGNSVLAISVGILVNPDKGNGAFATLSLYTPY